MKLKVVRLGDNGKATIGGFYIDGIFKCFTIEDEQRAFKVKGETRVPEGTYDVTLRSEGGYHAKYADKFKGIHKGMLAVSNAPDYKIIAAGMEFQYILIHVGNFETNTNGCLLLNYGVDATTFNGANSTACYKAIYPQIADAIAAGETCTIEYIDIEEGK